MKKFVCLLALALAFALSPSRSEAQCLCPGVGAGFGFGVQSAFVPVRSFGFAQPSVIGVNNGFNRGFAFAGQRQAVVVNPGFAFGGNVGNTVVVNNQRGLFGRSSTTVVSGAGNVVVVNNQRGFRFR